MKNIALVTLLFTFCSFQLSAQTKLKRKYYGTYEGQINAFPMEMDKKIVQVQTVAIQIEVNAGLINMKIGNRAFGGEYKVLFEADDYFVLDVDIENQEVGERIVVYKRGDKISRDGLFPQPSARLFKN